MRKGVLPSFHCRHSHIRPQGRGKTAACVQPILAYAQLKARLDRAHRYVTSKARTLRAFPLLWQTDPSCLGVGRLESFFERLPTRIQPQYLDQCMHSVRGHIVTSCTLRTCMCAKHVAYTTMMPRSLERKEGA